MATDNPVTEPVLSDLLYKDVTPVEETVESPTEAETVDEEVDAPVESEESESEAEESDTDAEVDAEPDELFEIPDGDKTAKVNRKELVDGYLRQSDYTRKTQAVAEDRKAVDAEKAKVEETVKVLGDIGDELQTLIMGDITNVNWNEVRDTDPSEYLRLKEVEAQRQKVMGNLVEKRNQIIKAKTEAEASELHKVLGWSDGKKKQADIDSITGFMQEQGITDQVTSHKLMLAILDAAKYQQLQKSKVETLKEIKQAPKTPKPVKSVKPSAPKSLEDMLYK